MCTLLIVVVDRGSVTNMHKQNNYKQKERPQQQKTDQPPAVVIQTRAKNNLKMTPGNKNTTEK